MSQKNTLRVDKTCLNCKHVVAERFCPNCGQENSISRKTFYHLFIHFFEDLTHYENAFWKTIKNLIKRPASLTKEYLSGKRLSYLAPIRLYIFISFITFFIFSIMPNSIEEVLKIDKEKNEALLLDTVNVSNQELKLKKLLNEGKLTKREYDTLIVYTKKSLEKEGNFHFGGKKYKSVKEMDSLQKIETKKLSSISYWVARKLLIVTQNKTKEEIVGAFLKSFKQNIPKALFVYMPLFAFVLWLFYDKKKWYYFEHGIFTLHFFSFLLLIILFATLLIKFIYLFGENGFTKFIDDAINIIVLLWFIYYFYRANKNFYQESSIKSFIKSSILIFINTILMFFILLFFIIYSFITIK